MPTLLQTVLIAVICMAVICSLLLPSIPVLASCMLCVVSINVGVCGLLMHWGVRLGPWAMVTIIMSIGFSVDYIAHVASRYFHLNDVVSCYLSCYKELALEANMQQIL